MAMVVVDYSSIQGTYSPRQEAWFEDRRPLGAVIHSSNEPSELSQWPCGHDDGTTNVLVVITMVTVEL